MLKKKEEIDILKTITILLIKENANLRKELILKELEECKDGFFSKIVKKGKNK